MIPFIIQLLIAHFIGDFVLQPTKWIQDRNIKKIKSGYLYLHILVHSVLLLIVLKFNQSYFPGIVFIAITHYLIDLSKSYLTKTVNTRKLFSSINQRIWLFYYWWQIITLDIQLNCLK